MIVVMFTIILLSSSAFIYKKYRDNFICSILSLLYCGFTVITLTLQVNLGDVSLIANSREAIYLVMFLLMYYAYKSFVFNGKPLMITALFLAGLFSLLTIIGISFLSYANLDFILLKREITALVYIGYFWLFYLALSLFFEYSEKAFNENTLNYQNKKIEKNIFWVGFIFLMLCYIPYLIVYYPASITNDIFYQIRQIVGISSKNNHHPYFLSMFYAWLFGLGSNVNDNFGFFLITITQTVVSCLAFSYMSLQILKLKVPMYFSVCTLLFFGLVPMFGIYMQMLVKDVLYIGVFAFYVTETVMLLKTGHHNFSTRRLFLYFLVSLLICLLRNNGFYIILPTLIALCIYFKNTKFAVSSIIVILVYQFSQNVVLPTMGVDEGSIREALSIPFQQTARLVKEHHNDLTEEDREIIDSILDYDTIGTVYYHSLSDPVKSTFNHNYTSEQLATYFKNWFDNLLKYPKVYVEAFLGNTYGYYAPIGYDYGVGYYFDIADTEHNQGYFDVYYLNSQEIRDKVQNLFEMFRKLPIVNLVTNVGIYTWILITMVFALIRKRRFVEVIAYIPAIMNVAICLASPVNGYIRYALPLIVSMPILISYMLMSTKPATLKNKL